MTADGVWFSIFPYVALALAGVGLWSRLRGSRYSVSSLSSQFLEGRALFWASVPGHYGLIVVLTWHFLAFLMPGAWTAWNSDPARLRALEITLLAFGLCCLLGVGVFILRRLFSLRARVVTSAMDWVVLGLLLVQVLTGILTATLYRWGSGWYLDTATPYLRSLVTLIPDHARVAVLPLLVRIHVIGAFTMLAILPFSRLIHLILFPIDYLWRAPQLVIWNRKTATPERGE